jgi:hypothetical protein
VKRFITALAANLTPRERSEVAGAISRIIGPGDRHRLANLDVLIPSSLDLTDSAKIAKSLSLITHLGASEYATDPSFRERVNAIGTGDPVILSGAPGDNPILLDVEHFVSEDDAVSGLASLADTIEEDGITEDDILQGTPKWRNALNKIKNRISEATADVRSSTLNNNRPVRQGTPIAVSSQGNQPPSGRVTNGGTPQVVPARRGTPTTVDAVSSPKNRRVSESVDSSSPISADAVKEEVTHSQDRLEASFSGIQSMVREMIARMETDASALAALQSILGKLTTALNVLEADDSMGTALYSNPINFRSADELAKSLRPFLLGSQLSVYDRVRSLIGSPAETYFDDEGDLGDHTSDQLDYFYGDNTGIAPTFTQQFGRSLGNVLSSVGRTIGVVGRNTWAGLDPNVKLAAGIGAGALGLGLVAKRFGPMLGNLAVFSALSNRNGTGPQVTYVVPDDVSGDRAELERWLEEEKRAGRIPSDVTIDSLVASTVASTGVPPLTSYELYQLGDQMSSQNVENKFLYGVPGKIVSNDDAPRETFRVYPRLALMNDGTIVDAPFLNGVRAIVQPVTQPSFQGSPDDEIFIGAPKWVKKIGSTMKKIGKTAGSIAKLTSGIPIIGAAAKGLSLVGKISGNLLSKGSDSSSATNSRASSAVTSDKTSHRDLPTGNISADPSVTEPTIPVISDDEEAELQQWRNNAPDARQALEGWVGPAIFVASSLAGPILSLFRSKAPGSKLDEKLIEYAGAPPNVSGSRSIWSRFTSGLWGWLRRLPRAISRLGLGKTALLAIGGAALVKALWSKFGRKPEDVRAAYAILGDDYAEFSRLARGLENGSDLSDEEELRLSMFMARLHQNRPDLFEQPTGEPLAESGLDTAIRETTGVSPVTSVAPSNSGGTSTGSLLAQIGGGMTSGPIPTPSVSLSPAVPTPLVSPTILPDASIDPSGHLNAAVSNLPSSLGENGSPSSVSDLWTRLQPILPMLGTVLGAGGVAWLVSRLMARQQGSSTPVIPVSFMGDPKTFVPAVLEKGRSLESGSNPNEERVASYLAPKISRYIVTVLGHGERQLSGAPGEIDDYDFYEHL